MTPLTWLRVGVLWLLCAAAAAAAKTPADEVFLFAYFTGNGESGLHLATSEDGLKWTALREGASFLKPEVGESKLMRDPCILRGPDGVYHLVWTTSWTGVTIGYASSRDLKTWTPQRAIPVMAHEPTTVNCWAPELIYDEEKQHYLIFWSSTIPGRFPTREETERRDQDKPPRNHRLYSTTTKDFNTFTPTRLHYDPGFNVIDETMVRDGDGWVMFVKNETEIPAAAKYHYVVRSASPDGPWSEPGAPLPPAGVWVEGPTPIKIGEWWHVYFDKYTQKKYGVIRSKDLVNWEDLSDQLVVPKGIRHGTVIRVPRALVEALR